MSSLHVITPYHLLFHYCHHQDVIFQDELWCCSCIIVHCELPLSPIDTTNNISPAVSKKKCSGASKCSKKLVEDPNHLLVSFQHHLLLLHVLYPQKLTQLSIKDVVVSFVFFIFFLDFDLFDCCGCGCDS